MKLLLDTHLLLWAADDSPRLSQSARELIENVENELIFSVLSLWEVGIKRAVPRDQPLVHPRDLRNALLDIGYQELPLTGEHALGVEDLPPIHKDPFDRMLIAQARSEGITLLTADTKVAQYPGRIRRV